MLNISDCLLVRLDKYMEISRLHEVNIQASSSNKLVLLKANLILIRHFLEHVRKNKKHQKKKRQK